MNGTHSEADPPPQMKPIATASDYDQLNAGLLSPEMRLPVSAPLNADGETSGYGRFRSGSVCGFGGEAARLEEVGKSHQKLKNMGLSTEDRLFRLEKESLRLLSAST